VRRLVALAVTAALSAFVFLPGAAHAASAPVVTPAFFGMHDPFEEAGVPYGSMRIWDLGTTWADLEPEPGTFAFDRLDGLVDRAVARGDKVTLVLSGTPAWAAQDPTAESAKWLSVGSSSPPRDVADWATFVGTVASRYQGRIDSYQIWNEASLPQFWRGSAADLAWLTKVAYHTIKAWDPAAKVVSTPMLPRQPTWSTWSVSYLKALKSLGWPVDVFAIHSYQPDRQATPEGRVANIKKMQAVLASVKAPAKPMWDTEANYTSNAFAKYKITGQQSADWVARAYLDSLRFTITRTYWYAYDAPVGHLGITMTPGSAAARAFSSVQSWLVGRTWKGCTTVPVTKKVTVKAKVGGRWVKKRTTVKTGTVVTTCTFARGRTKSWVTWASIDKKLARAAKATKVKALRAPKTKAKLPVRARTVCRLLTGCTRTTTRTVVTSSPVLLRR
jgi:hypothetical protein